MNNRNSGGVRTSTMTYEEWDKLLDKASQIPQPDDDNMSDTESYMMNAYNKSQYEYITNCNTTNKNSEREHVIIGPNPYISMGEDVIYTLVLVMCGCMSWYLIMQNHSILAIMQFFIFIMMVSRK
ncbi:MAG: hypothetical protein WC877_01155 [Dehalococcoidales bacterium]|jgi:hypothetical protein